MSDTLELLRAAADKQAEAYTFDILDPRRLPLLKEYRRLYDAYMEARKTDPRFQNA